MSVVQELYTLNNKQFIRTYSNTGHYVIGGNPYGAYVEAIDPIGFNRTYVEGDLIPEEEEISPEEITNILLGNS